MRPSDIRRYIKMAEASLKAGKPVNVCFSGAPGLGKSALSGLVAKELGYEYLDVRLAQMEAPDVRGIQREIPGTGRLKYLLPSLRPEKGKVVINLDEVNRAPRSNMNAVLQLLQERRIGDLEISDEAIIIACINEGPEYDVNELDPAVRDRFLFVPIEYDHSDFINYATDEKFHQDVLGFLKSGLWVYRLPSELGDKKYLANRSWTRLNSAYSSALDDQMRDEVIKLELGPELAKVFFSWKADNKPLMLEDFIKNEAEALKILVSLKDRQDLMATLVLDLGLKMAPPEVLPTYGRIIEELPMDLGVQVFYDQLKKYDQKDIGTNEAPIDYLKKVFANLVCDVMPKKFRDRFRAAVKASDEACAKINAGGG